MSEQAEPSEPSPQGVSGAPKGEGAQLAGNLLASAGAGAVKGAAVGGLHGAAVGAIKSASISFAKSKQGRTLIVGVAVLLCIVPMLALVLLSGLSAVLGVAGSEEAAQTESTDVVLNGADGSGTNVVMIDGEPVTIDMLSYLQDLTAGTVVPWQVVLSLTQSPGGAGAGTTTPPIQQGQVPEDLGECPATGLGVEEGLTPNALLVLRCGAAAFPQIDAWGGVGGRPNNPQSDHPNGRAIDAMTTFTGDYTDPEAIEVGWEMARFYADHAEDLGVHYVIYQAQIWVSTNNEGWVPYRHPSGATDDTNMHMDHVHISVFDDGSEAGSGGNTSPGTGGGAGGGIAQAGWGPFHLVEEPPESFEYTQEQAEDFEQSAQKITDWLAPRLTRLSTSSDDLRLGTGTVTLEDGQRIIISETESGATGEGSDRSALYNQTAWEAASKVRENFVTAISEMPIDEMDEDGAEVYYERALTWYLGQEYAEASTGGLCIPATTGDGSDPAELDGVVVNLSDGSVLPLNQTQLRNAATIIAVAGDLGIDVEGQAVSLMTALAESKLIRYGSTVYPGSETEADTDDSGSPYVGSDHDSVGLFQQRPQTGWGTWRELLDAEYSARAFFGGPDGPNSYGSGSEPPGLLDIDRQGLTLGQQAQAVQRSAFPTAYDPYEQAAYELLEILGGVTCSGAGQVSATGWARPTDPSVGITSVFGCRVPPPTSGVAAFHFGVDFAGPEGSPIYAAADGVVVYAGAPTPWHSGYVIIIDHGGGLYTEYNHMYSNGLLVSVGESVAGGQQIAKIGNAGNSTGPHLHFSMMTMDGDPLHPSYESFIDPVPVFIENGVDVWAGQTPKEAANKGPQC